jgi:hypothetical protein
MENSEGGDLGENVPRTGKLEDGIFAIGGGTTGW